MSADNVAVPEHAMVAAATTMAVEMFDELTPLWQIHNSSGSRKPLLLADGPYSENYITKHKLARGVRHWKHGLLNREPRTLTTQDEFKACFYIVFAAVRKKKEIVSLPCPLA